MTRPLPAAHGFALALLLLFLPAGLRAQQASVQGVVTSSGSGSPQEAVAVLLERGGERLHGTVTDRNGYYQIGGIASGTYTLRSQHLGHAEHRVEVTLAPGERLTLSFRLDPVALSLGELVVAAETGPTVTELGRQRVTPADLRLVPVPAGSGDLASYLQTLPGVTTTGDRGGQVFVRGGTAAENLVLVDGIPIYQPFHILGFFSVFPEDLVSSVDFYAGGFGARYTGRTSSVLDVGLRDGNPVRTGGAASVSPFLVEALAEGPILPGISWLASFRRSLVEESGPVITGDEQPISFDSQLFKVTGTAGDDLRCSALALRTSDRGRLDAQQTGSFLRWRNLVFGGRCTAQLQGFLRMVEANFSYSSIDNTAVSRGSSRFGSNLWRMQHDAHVTSLLGALPLYTGYHLYAELTEHDLAELLGSHRGSGNILGLVGYAELSLPLGRHAELRPGTALTVSPQLGLEPRIRASWEPFGRPSEKLQGAFGLYQQHIMGTSDMRDVSSVFTAWMETPNGVALEAMQGMLGWQQSLPLGLRWSAEGYYKRMKEIRVPAWSSAAQFETRLNPAEGTAYGVDTRVELRASRFQGFLGYGYAETTYETRQSEFARWFGDSVQVYHPPHDRRHQLNLVGNLELGGVTASARWQLGSGLPFTRPIGFHEGYDFADRLHDVTADRGNTSLILARPFNGRLPVTHRLDLSLRREFPLAAGTLSVQAGAINAYDRRNMFYYDLYSGSRVDQLPLAPYASLTLRSR